MLKEKFMRGLRILGALAGLSILAGVVFAQTTAKNDPAKVDFAKDVLPILRQNCVPCHGPTVQSSGMRLDRKSVVLGRRGGLVGQVFWPFYLGECSPKATAKIRLKVMST